MLISSIYISSVFQDYESFLRTEFDLVEDDIRLALDENNSCFVTYELETGIYTFKDLSKAPFNNLQEEYELSNDSVDIEFDDIAMKTKLVVRPGTITLRFDEKSFFSTILVFKYSWDYKHCNEYISEKMVNVFTTTKIHLKCEVIDGSVVNGLRPPILYSFILDEASGFKTFCEPETIHFKKINKSTLNTVTFSLEDDNHGKVSVNGETLTFTLQND